VPSHTCSSEKKLVYAPVDLEGHLGQDGRYYLIDSARLLPPNPPVAGYLSRSRYFLCIAIARGFVVQNN
jgi:hypothetical protein